MQRLILLRRDHKGIQISGREHPPTHTFIQLTWPLEWYPWESKDLKELV